MSKKERCIIILRPEKWFRSIVPVRYNVIEKEDRLLRKKSVTRGEEEKMK
jgi:hypothetical protein